MSRDWKWIKNGHVTSTPGFVASGIPAGIKAGKKDMGLLVSLREAVAAGTFTTNTVKAGPVRVSMEHLRSPSARAVIFNSGNANCCNGLGGIRDAKDMTELSAKALKVRTRQVFVCSTGRIGVPLPMAKVRRGIAKSVEKLSVDGGKALAKAMMTTDTFSKECALNFLCNGRTVTIGGAAKGAGMIHPNMATMLSFITTDAVIDKKTLQLVTNQAVDESFNRISVDGDTSTNDTVLVMANGLAGNPPIKTGDSCYDVFRLALREVMRFLARQIVEDGEGITKVVEVRIQGASTQNDAKRAAEAIARSPLVKSSWCGNDPNWGRLMGALGYSGSKVREELVDIHYNGLCAVQGGQASRTPFSRIRKVVRQRHYTITIDLHLGPGEYVLLVNDLTERYVTLNKGE